MRIVGGTVDGQAYKGALGNCMVVGWINDHADHHLVWVCLMDETGQSWLVENPYIRARANLTWGRNAPEEAQVHSHSFNVPAFQPYGI